MHLKTTTAVNKCGLPLNTLLLSLLFYCFSNSINANELPVLQLNNYDNSQFIGHYMVLYKDSNNDKTLATILQLEDKNWLRIENNQPNYGFDKSTFWLRLEVKNNTHTKTSMLLTIANAALDKISLFEIKDKILLNQYTMGDHLPFDSRPINNHNFVIPLDLEIEESKILYLKINNEGSVQLPISLRKHIDFITQEQDILFNFGIYFGIMLIMFLYNIFLFIAVKDISYFYFAIAILSGSALQLALNGFGFQYLWPSYPEINLWMLSFSNATFQAVSGAFILNFLKVKKYSSFQSNLLMWLIYISIVIAIFCFILPYHIMVIITTFLVLPLSLAAVIISATALRRGVHFAQFFLLSWIIYTTFLFILALNKFGILPRTFLTENGMLFGNVSSILFLSLALADRINVEKKQRLFAEKNVLMQEKKARAERENYLELDIKHKEEELRTQKEILAAKEEALTALSENKIKSNFLATMSHEIRTPLNGILGVSEMLEDTKLNKKQKQHIDMIKNSGSSLLNIINDILDYSKIEAGKMEIEAHEFHLNNLCQETIDNFYLLAKKKNVSLTSYIEVDTPTYLTSDSNRLRQILLNLLGNALKFTQDGCISLSVKNIQQDYDPKLGHLIKFEIKDTGIGISPKERASLFKKFSQADSSTTRKYGGTGLGLSICKRLTNLMGGKIGVESEKGQGSIFWFTIRALDASKSFIEQCLRPNNGQTKSALLEQYKILFSNKTALIAEDNKVNQIVIKNLVDKLGISATLVDDGQKALDYIQENHSKIDFVLMDCEMPNMSGYQATRSVRKWEKKESLSPMIIIALTAHALQEHKKESLKAGMNAHIFKPLEIKVFCEVLAKQLSTREI